MKRITITIITAGFLAVTMLAQGPEGENRRGRKGPGVDKAVAFLALSEDQVTQLNAIRQGIREDSRGLFAQIGELSKKLREEMVKESPSASEVGFLTVEIHSLKKQVGALHSAAHADSVAVLNEEQTQKLSELQAARDLAPTIGQGQALNLLEGGGPGPGPESFGPRPGFGGGLMGPRGGDGPGSFRRGR